jgi:polyisoprenyl-phosphate glycosyltransferase
VSVVAPAHNEAACLPELVRRLTAVLDGLGQSWEVVLVDDGSTDRTWHVIRDLAESDPRVRGIRLSRNFGHQPALSAGLSAASGETVITMDADLQHPPELIPQLLQKSAEDFAVVYAVRGAEDSESRFKIWSASAFYWLINRLTRLDLPAGAADFRLMKRPVVNALLAMPEQNRFLRGMTRWVGFPQTSISYEREKRSAGETKYSLFRMLTFAFDAITGFSSFPLRVASLLGMVIAGFGWVYLIYVVAVGVISGTAVAGWSSVLATTLILGGVELAFFGIMGQYVGRMYIEVKQRPLFVVWDDTDPRDSDLEPRPSIDGRTHPAHAADPDSIYPTGTR